MLTREEARLIADAINTLRPDWGVAGLMQILGDDRIRIRRQYRDTAIALVALAVDPDCRKPTRIFEHGPWWEAAAPFGTQAKPMYRRPSPLDCAVCSLPEPECRRRPGDHEFDPRPHQKAAPPEGLKALISGRTDTTTEGEA